jgi:RHS repeat-associated protein
LKSEYVFFNGDRVARRDFGPTGSTGVFYYFSDHLKTASVITDSAGNIKSDSDYYPWGGELQFIANDSNHYKFTGKERDTETGLDYFGARYYSNGLGRFITPDWAAKAAAVPYAEFADPQSLNLYTYVRNVPTTNGDSDGHRCVLCAEVEEKIEELASDAKVVAATLAGIAKATTIDTLLTGGGVTLLAVPPVAATTFAATQNFEGPSDCSAAYCNMYASFGNSSQSQSQQGDSQQAEPEPEPAAAGGGARKGGKIRLAQRNAMREEGIPTSQQPSTQISPRTQGKKSGRQYTYTVPKQGGGTETKIVTRQHLDRNHGPHVEAGKPKANGQTDPSGRARHSNQKTKIVFNN